MIDDWHTTTFRSDQEPEERTLSLDRHGIPILNEVIDPERLQSEPDDDDLQQYLLFAENTQTDIGKPEQIDPTLIRTELIEEIRQEMLTVIEQTSDSIAEQFRSELAATLKESLNEALEQKLQALSETPHRVDAPDNSNP